MVSNDNDWEGLMSTSKCLEAGESEQGSVNRGSLPPFEKLKAMFVDELSASKRKKMHFCEVRAQASEEEGGEDSGMEEHGEDSPTASSRGKSKLTSGFFSRASDTKIVRQVVHAHAMLDSEETNLSQAMVVERYAGFLRKIEKGKLQWGSERKLEENLRFQVFTSSAKVRGEQGKMGDSGKKGTGSKASGMDRKFYCTDFNRGQCQFSESHEGRFNRMMVKKIHICKVCWEKDGVEQSHPEGHAKCVYRTA